MAYKGSFASLCLLSFVTLPGCFGAEFTPSDPSFVPAARAAESIRVVSERPGPGYVEAGLLSGGGASFDGALKRIKETAAQEGCAVIVILGEAVQTGPAGPGSRYGGMSSTHIRASCYVPVTDEEDADGQVTGGAKGPKAPPQGAAGFSFGQKIDDARAACAVAGKVWTAADDGGECSGSLQETGFEGPVSLTACADRVCGIDVDATPAEGAKAEWPRVFGSIRRTLSAKYGYSTQDVQLPQECAETVPACLRDGRAHATMTWAWKSGFTISLTMHGPEGGDQGPVLYVAYRSPPPRFVPKPAAL